METVKEKYTIGISIFTIGYLMWRKDNYFADPIYDHIVLSILLLVLWFIFFSHRTFVMTRSRLRDYYSNNSKLEYKSLMIRGEIKEIYVRVKGYTDWYKLDYLLTIPKDCGYNIYEEFVDNNKTIGDLLKTMDSKSEDALIGGRYRIMKSNYKVFKYMSLIFLIIFEIFYWVIYSNTITSHMNTIIY